MTGFLARCLPERSPFLIMDRHGADWALNERSSVFGTQREKRPGCGMPFRFRLRLLCACGCGLVSVCFFFLLCVSTPRRPQADRTGKALKRRSRGLCRGGVPTLLVRATSRPRTWGDAVKLRTTETMRFCSGERGRKLAGVAGEIVAPIFRGVLGGPTPCEDVNRRSRWRPDQRARPLGAVAQGG